MAIDEKKEAPEQEKKAPRGEMMTFEQVMEEVEDGAEIELPSREEPELEDTFTEENIVKFLAGEITFAELQGMTMEEAYNLAEVGFKLFQESKYHDAKTVFEGLVISNPYDAYFHTMLGACYHELDMTDEALAQYAAAIEIDDTALHAYVNRAEILALRGEVKEALDDLEKAVALDPDGKDPAAERARTLAAAIGQAVAVAKKALAAYEAEQKKGAKK